MSKRKYYSIYGSTRKLSAHQYVAELVINRRAKHQGNNLPDLFWKDPEYEWWLKELKKQAVKATALLRIYSDDAIISALRSKEGQHIYSLYINSLESIIKKEQKSIDATSIIRKENPSKLIGNAKNTTSIPNKAVGNKSVLNKLR